jgi:hypothetical protein
MHIEKETKYEELYNMRPSNSQLVDNKSINRMKSPSKIFKYK